MVIGHVKERTFLHWTRGDLAAELDTRQAWSESLHWRSKRIRPVAAHTLRQPVSQDEAMIVLMGRLQYAAELLKEYVFEDVRRVHFSERPSRRSCMYLFDTAEDPEAYASAMNLERNVLYQVEVISGQLHRAPIAALNCNARTHDEMVEHARRYWTHTEPNIGTEVLFEGMCRLSRLNEAHRT
jgi:Protein of unknown function (DUF2441)